MAGDIPRFVMVVDLETSGSDRAVDYVLEVGVIIADSTSLEEVAAFSCVINPDLDFMDQPSSRPSWKDRIFGNPNVLRVHTENGLIADVAEHGVRLRTCEDNLLSFLGDHGQRMDFMPMGSGVCHFDRDFIRRDLPRVDKLLTKRALDVGDFRRRLQMAGRTELVYEPQWKAHRALADANMHLDEARTQLQLLLMIPAPEGADNGA